MYIHRRYDSLDMQDVYSCFDKGCPDKSVKAYATMPIGIMGSKGWYYG